MASHKTTVRVVLFAESPFEQQWNDQVLPPRREDWREFVAEKVEAKRAVGALCDHFVISATVSLQFLIAVLKRS